MSRYIQLLSLFFAVSLGCSQSAMASAGASSGLVNEIIFGCLDAQDIGDEYKNFSGLKVRANLPGAQFFEIEELSDGPVRVTLETALDPKNNEKETYFSGMPYSEGSPTSKTLKKEAGQIFTAFNVLCISGDGGPYSKEFAGPLWPADEVSSYEGQATLYVSVVCTEEDSNFLLIPSYVAPTWYKESPKTKYLMVQATSEQS